MRPTAGYLILSCLSIENAEMSWVRRSHIQRRSREDRLRPAHKPGDRGQYLQRDPFAFRSGLY